MIEVFKSKNIKTHNMKDISLMLSMFFLPFGYDYFFKVIMDLTDSYWIADGIFYLISLVFFIMYLYYARKIKSEKK